MNRTCREALYEDIHVRGWAKYNISEVVNTLYNFQKPQLFISHYSGVGKPHLFLVHYFSLANNRLLNPVPFYLIIMN